VGDGVGGEKVLGGKHSSAGGVDIFLTKPLIHTVFSEVRGPVEHDVLSFGFGHRKKISISCFLCSNRKPLEVLRVYENNKPDYIRQMALNHNWTFSTLIPKKSIKCCQQNAYFKAKMHQIRFWLHETRLRFRWWSLQCYIRSPSWI